MTRTRAQLITLLGVVAALFALPASALAKGTWLKDPDLAHVKLSWQTDDGSQTYYVIFKFSQSVDSATSPEGTCRVESDPTTIRCSTIPPTGGLGPSSGTVSATLKADVWCAESFPMRASFTGQTDTDQQPLTSANDCSPPPDTNPNPNPNPVPTPTPDSTPAGEPVAKPKLPVVVGMDSGGAPRVRVFNLPATAPLADFLAYGSGFSGGVRVAAGDVNGDGIGDVITGAGPGGGPNVKVFDGKTGDLLQSFFAFDPAFLGGIYVAAGDVNGDGKADVVVGAGQGGGPQVKVFSGADGSVLRSFFAYDAGFTGGVRVAAGDVNGDGRADVLAGTGPGGGPHVKVFDGVSGAQVKSFFAFDPGFTGGVFVAAGDVNGDGKADIVVGAGNGAGPHVKVFSGGDGSVLRSFFAYDAGFSGGVRVAAGDVNGDGLADIVTGTGPGGGPHVKAFDAVGGSALESFFAFDVSFTGGVFVGAGGFAGARVDLGTVLTLDLSRGAGVPLSCPASTLGGCRGLVTLLLPAVQKVGKAAAKRRARKPVVLGKAKFTVAAGKKASVRVKLTKRGRRAIGKRKRIKATIHVVTRDGGGNVSATDRPLVLKLAR